MADGPKPIPAADAPIKDWDEYYESHGPAKIEMLLRTGGWPQALHASAHDWLGRREAKAKTPIQATGPVIVNKEA
jgi:hypothetical protein